MRRMKFKGSTLPELLVAMLLGGILLLLVFDGVDMLRMSLSRYSLNGFGEDLGRLERYEMLAERSDSIDIGDSVRFFQNGEIIGICEKWN
ncbi:MAG TPA: hypothetical protein DDX40_08920 [Rikenellaceae bacterium]|nr:hypothetical protein [Rikenellaceae bacterium]